MSLMRRTGVFILLVLLVGLWPASASARPGWKRAIDRQVRGHNMSVSVRDAGRFCTSGTQARIGSRHRTRSCCSPWRSSIVSIPKSASARGAMATSFGGGVVFGDLWIMGRGDPSITGGGRYGRSLPFSPTRLGRLAQNLKRAGVTRITGGVRGSTRYYAHDWWAPGWKSSFPSQEVALPSALTFEGNTRRNKHINDPESRAARSYAPATRPRHQGRRDVRCRDASARSANRGIS